MLYHSFLKKTSVSIFFYYFGFFYVFEKIELIRKSFISITFAGEPVVALNKQ